MNFSLICAIFFHICVCCISGSNIYMKKEQKDSLRCKSKEMFFHAYNNYMNFAFPADELMPLSCKGRYRDAELPRGTVDEALGGFSLTLLDSLDTLFIMGELDEFDQAVRLACLNVAFDSDVTVSVFETNIRALGGLLGGHVSALAVKTANASRMTWYDRQLLDMAIDLGNRLLPAFNTSTGLPYPRINLKSGKPTPHVNTCTACAGTLILEFAALSRLSGNPIYELKASNALSYLWRQRNRHSDLVGTEINIDNGEWIQQESGVGAGIDSYYESLLKAYGLLGDKVYLHRFQTHYSAVQRYMGAPGQKAFPFSFLSVFMHRPSQRSRHYMDALQAFWPGLQTINGDLNAAVAHHEMLYMVHKRHGLLPEAFTTEMEIYWPHYLIRPELAESTYLLYKSTGDAYYLHVGAELLSSIEKHTWVPCGFAAIEDIRTMEHSDRLDSFVLAETFKYFYLLFSDPADLPIDLDDYILTTEAHLLPIGLPERPLGNRGSSQTPPPPTPATPYKRAWSDACPAPTEALRLQRARRLLQSGGSDGSVCDAVGGPRLWHRLEDEIRQPLRSLAVAMRSERAAGASPSSRWPDSPLLEASSFKVDNITHLQMLRQMGISVSVGREGQIELKFDQSTAETPLLGISGMKFIEEVIQLNQASNAQKAKVSAEPARQEVIRHQTVALVHPPYFGRTRFNAGPSRFTLYPGEFSPPNQPKSPHSPNDPYPPIQPLHQEEPLWRPVVGPLVLVEPFDACSPVFADGFYAPLSELHSEFDVSEGEGEDGGLVGERGLLRGAIAVVKRGGCMFIEKAQHVKRMGAVGVIVVDVTPGTSASKDQFFHMSGEQPDGSPPPEIIESLPCVFLFYEEGAALVSAMARRWRHEASPALVAISKNDDSPRILSNLLRYLDFGSQERQADEENCFALVPSVEKPETHCFPKSQFSIALSDEGEWQITINPGDASDRFFWGNDSDEIFSKDPDIWSGFMDEHWPQATDEHQCKDLILAVSEALLSQTTDEDSPFKSNSVLMLSQNRVNHLNSCLHDLVGYDELDHSETCLDSHLRLRWSARATEFCAL